MFRHRGRYFSYGFRLSWKKIGLIIPVFILLLLLPALVQKKAIENNINNVRFTMDLSLYEGKKVSLAVSEVKKIATEYYSAEEG